MTRRALSRNDFTFACIRNKRHTLLLRPFLHTFAQVVAWGTVRPRVLTLLKHLPRDNVKTHDGYESNFVQVK